MSSYSSFVVVIAILGSLILSAHGFISPAAQRRTSITTTFRKSSLSASATSTPQNATKLYYQSPETSSTSENIIIDDLQIELERRRLLATVPLFHSLNEGDIARLSVLATPGKSLFVEIFDSI